MAASSVAIWLTETLVYVSFGFTAVHLFFLDVYFVRLGKKQPQNHDKEILNKNWKKSLYPLPHLACLSFYLVSVSLQHAGKHGEVCSIPHSHDVDSISVLCR